MSERRMGILILCSILGLFMMCTSCSVGMALSGKPDPNFSAFRVGSTRGEVELQLGKPISSLTTPEGRRFDTYEYEIGNAPSAGRAIGHGVMDVLTLGLWEVIGTPIEGFQGEKKQILIVYDKSDRVEAINQAPSVDADKPSTAQAAGASMGTGWLCSTGHIVTNHHIVQGHSVITLVLQDGSKIPAKIALMDRSNGIALLKPLTTDRLPPALPIAPQPARVKAPVYAIGYSHPSSTDGAPRGSEGTIVSLTGPMDDPRVYQVTVPLQAGNSGCPLMNSSGEVVGIAISRTDAAKTYQWSGDMPENVNFAIKIQYLSALTTSVQDESLPQGELPKGEASLEELVQRTKNSLVVVLAE